MALPVFKTVRPDCRRVGWVRFPCTPASSPVSRQRSYVGITQLVGARQRCCIATADTTRARAARLVARRLGTRATGQHPATPCYVRRSPDSLKPPLTPRRAFLYSFAHSRLRAEQCSVATRPPRRFCSSRRSAIAMIRESAADVHEARRLQRATVVVVSYVDATGDIAHADDGRPPRFDDAVRPRSRSAHVEDWIALLIANHLFAGADAFVAAQSLGRSRAARACARRRAARTRRRDR